MIIIVININVIINITTIFILLIVITDFAIVISIFIIISVVWLILRQKKNWYGIPEDNLLDEVVVCKLDNVEC